ncbi:hypothetical protein L293_1743 [Acinetobacter gyllenbergii CIP 110306 = MTCC 11365]|nr:hypothetical protein L293_1743 [Acinetobacter gyllenbergii CIP 110306 = MTCC 11365]
MTNYYPFRVYAVMVLRYDAAYAFMILFFFEFEHVKTRGL